MKTGKEPQQASLRSTNPNDQGYIPRQRLRATFDSADLNLVLADIDKPTLSEFSRTTTAQTFRGYISDVLDQYTTEYYGDEDPQRINTLIERLSMLSLPIFAINMPSMTPDPTTVEVMFDDLIEDTNGEEFCSKYGIIEFYRLLKQDMEDIEQDVHYDYKALAEHLEPQNSDLGRRRIDEAIIQCKRAQARQRNKKVLLGWIFITAAIVALQAVAPKILTIVDEIPTKISFLWRYAEAISLTQFLSGVTAYVILMFTGLHLKMSSYGPEPIPPSFIKAWLDIQPRPPYFEHWHEVHWSWIKQSMHRRQILGFDLWKPRLLHRSDYQAEIKRCENGCLFRRKMPLRANQIRAYIDKNAAEYP